MTKWQQHGWEAGSLGYPATDEIPNGDNIAIAYFDAIENGQPAPAARGTVSYGPCKIEPRYIHWRTRSGTGMGYGVAGFKPYTWCDVAVESIKHESDLRYKYWTTWPRAISATEQTTMGPVISFEQKNLSFHCTGKVMTRFGGRTMGTIIYGGKTYYAAVYPPTKELDCEV
ncbi:hypothetical protein [Rhodococcus sp. ABRD24]|uniref:hypothetical protein n=1 Tax=Rhodococcus sp. ABRD24 TaxID=2507582 RepID=UPI001F612605|nr:hypothetical protein [Rhodococcus sp. ABRD24]